jgi:hypothetical protein
MYFSLLSPWLAFATRPCADFVLTYVVRSFTRREIPPWLAQASPTRFVTMRGQSISAARVQLAMSAQTV